MGKKHTFLVLTLFSSSGVYGNTRRPKFVNRKPDFEIQTPGFYRHCDVFWLCVFRQLLGFLISKWQWIVMATLYTLYRSGGETQEHLYIYKDFANFVLSLMLTHLAITFIFVIWNSILWEENNMSSLALETSSDMSLPLAEHMVKTCHLTKVNLRFHQVNECALSPGNTQSTVRGHMLSVPFSNRCNQTSVTTWRP